MGELATTVTVGAAILVVTGVAIYLYERSLRKPGGRAGVGSTGDILGGVIDVFNPAAGRARDALQELEHSGPVAPTPQDGDDDPVRLVTDPDGTPRAVRIRRPR